ncbi:MAG TPA: winged helix-turn-helix domain-containing protein [Stellaceae bacterium]|nr:winged helix-turn-helix domain-containing protein [Stellaceae bacterium]
MDAGTTADILLFEGFRLDRCGGGLFRQLEGGASERLAIGSRALEVLGMLVDRRGELVTKAVLMEAVWPGIVVEENNLAVQISALRRLLDRGRPERSYIQTVPGRGYRFVASVTRAEAVAGSDVAARPQSGGRPRLSIVVLPFSNLNDDPEQQYFADAVTEDLTTDLSRIAGSFVISRNTAFTYKDNPVDTKRIGAELGVRYVLEGSVRRTGSQVRVNAQLIDAEADAHLWAERFVRDTGDLFSLQDEITRRIATTLNIELVNAEAARSVERPEPLDYILRGRAATNASPSRESRIKAIELFERALALDPHSVAARCYLATALSAQVLDNFTDSAAAAIERAELLAGQALTTWPRSPLAHYAKGQVLRAQRRHNEAILEYEIALTFDRNWVRALHALGQSKLFAGPIEDVIPLMEQALRLSPCDPVVGMFYFQIGRVHLLQSRTDEAVIWLEKAVSAMPAHPAVRAFLAATYGLNDGTKRAAAELAEARRLSGDDRYSSIARLRSFNSGAPKVRALHEATYYAGLRSAGMPED